jgi:hypothetical protein
MAERKIIFNRIKGIKASENPGDLFGHTPIRCSAGGQPQHLADSLNMPVNGNNQLARAYLMPETKVNAVGRTDNPAQEHAEPLAGAAASR